MSPASENRVVSTAFVAIVWSGAHWLCPDPEEREAALYLFITTFGYGHFIGAAGFGSPLATAWKARRTSWPSTVFSGVTLVTGFCVYSLLLARAPLAVLPFVLGLTWHTLENDRLLAAAYHAKRSARLAPVPTALRDHLWFAPLAAGMLALAACTQEVSQTFGLPAASWQPRLFDIYGIPALYHLVSWLVLILDRTRAEPGRSASHRIRSLGIAHAVPVVLGAAALAADGALARLVRELLYGPQVYLYWSTLHVIQTAVARGRPHAPAHRVTPPTLTPQRPEEHRT